MTNSKYCSKRPVQVACLMMQKDEGYLLHAWVCYHAALFGYDNLIVYDNGSGCAHTLKILEEIESLGVIVDRSKPDPIHFRQKGVLFRQRINQIQQAPSKRKQFDFFMPLDCDEFVALADGDSMCFDRERIHAYLSGMRGNGGVFRIAHSWLNAPASTRIFFRKPERKCFVAEGQLISLNSGFHVAKSHSTKPEVDTDIAHIHLHYKPYARMIMLTLDKLALDINTERLPDLSAGSVKKYRSAPNHARHVAKFILMSEEKYNAIADHEGLFESEDFERVLDATGALPPFGTY